MKTNGRDIPWGLTTLVWLVLLLECPAQLNPFQLQQQQRQLQQQAQQQQQRQLQQQLQLQRQQQQQQRQIQPTPSSAQGQVRNGAAPVGNDGDFAARAANLTPAQRQQQMQATQQIMAKLKENRDAGLISDAQYQAAKQEADAEMRILNNPASGRIANSSQTPAAMVVSPPYDWNQFNDTYRPPNPNAQPWVHPAGATEANPNPIRWSNSNPGDPDLPISRRRNLDLRQSDSDWDQFKTPTPSKDSSKGSAWENFGKDSEPGKPVNDNARQPVNPWKGKSEAEIKAHLKLVTDEYEAGVKSEADYIKDRNDCKEALRAASGTDGSK